MLFQSNQKSKEQFQVLPLLQLNKIMMNWLICESWLYKIVCSYPHIWNLRNSLHSNFLLFIQGYIMYFSSRIQITISCIMHKQVCIINYKTICSYRVSKKLGNVGEIIRKNYKHCSIWRVVESGGGLTFCIKRTTMYWRRVKNTVHVCFIRYIILISEICGL